MPVLSAAALTEMSQKMLAAGGVGGTEADLVAKSLVEANLCGHDSHGVMRLPYYIDCVAKKEVVPGVELHIIRESDSLVSADGNWGFGQTQARRLMDLLIAKAQQTGVGVGTLIRCGHIGRLGEYCEQAAAAGMVSMLMVNTHGVARRVAPVGGTAPRLGTNPLGIGVPSKDGTLILDFGTSATAEGKVRVKKIAGQQVPDGWLLDSDGKPTNDPNTLYGTPPGTILPMGGNQAYKGFGLAMMIEIFSGALSGGVTIREKPINQNGNCVFMQVINPAALGGAEHFAAEVTQLNAFVRSCPRMDGVPEILLPGDPERRTFAERSKNGVPLDDGNWNQLKALADKLGVATSV
ncbi:MAG: Ldh family oxidoreductase [Planctomycetia bacterium]|nr:Ldh family oxidoreductase [Planctomycetia bacterium]